MSIVSLVKCEEYDDYDKVKAAVVEAIELAGGIDIKEGQVILLKANLVTALKPEVMATTHPTVVRAVAEYVLQKGGKPIIGDSPGAVYNKGRLTSVYNVTGMTGVATQTGAKLNDNFESQNITYPEGIALKRFDVIDIGEKVDGIINLAKYKSHSFTGISGAVKNLYGMIPGLKKVELHGSHTRLEKFCDLLIDIQERYKPKMLMHITDAIVGMDGAGPTSGNPHKIGSILASKCPYSSDIVAVKITNNDLEKIPMLTRAIDRELVDKDQIQAVGSSIDDRSITDFNNVKLVSNQPLKKIPKWLQGFVFRRCTQRPIIPKNKCRGCGKCYEHCPPKAITMYGKCSGDENKARNGKIAKVDTDKCIRCFCCQELCPFHIVKVKTPLIAKLMNKLG